MKNGWPMVPLGEVADSVERPEVPIPGTQYRQIGVRLWGEGSYEREAIDGSETKYATLNRCEAGDIIVNKIWARNGSVAVVQAVLDGTYGSGEFPTFRPRRPLLLPEWFHWFSKTPRCREQCDLKSQGTSGKNRIKPAEFLKIDLPLPPIAEQRRIVARIEELAAKIAEARGLRQCAGAEANALEPVLLGTFFRSLVESNEVIALGHLSSCITDGPHKTPQYVDEGVPFVTVKNMVTGRLDFRELRYITRQDHEEFSKRCKPQRGDVLDSKDGASAAVHALSTAIESSTSS